MTPIPTPAPRRTTASRRTSGRSGSARPCAALPPGQRQAVELLAIRDRSLAEASAETGRSKVALKVNLHRALKALRARMPGEG